MPNIVNGVVEFKENAYPSKKDLYEKLATGQSPEALFITCSDSRISPNLITQTDPGEIFVCRNAGNIVPPYSDTANGMSASVEYASAVLQVPHIVICGHSDCGAMKGAMYPEGLSTLPHVAEWVSYSNPAVETVNKTAGDADDATRINMLIEQNVLLQMENLKTHPSVGNRHQAGEVIIHGWVYDIRTGDVAAYDEETGKFLPVEERYADEIATLTQCKTACQT